MKTLYFEEVEEGDELPPIDLLLTKDFVRKYAKTAGMDFPRFTDDEGARQEGLPGMIAPGVLSMGLLARLIGEWNQAAQITRIGTTFRSPVLPDCAIHLLGLSPKRMQSDIRLSVISGWRTMMENAGSLARRPFCCQPGTPSIQRVEQCKKDDLAT